MYIYKDCLYDHLRGFCIFVFFISFFNVSSIFLAKTCTSRSYFSFRMGAFQSTCAASLCRCRWWWRTPAAAASTAPSPLTTTSTPTLSSSSPASSATARETSRGPGRSSSGGTMTRNALIYADSVRSSANRLLASCDRENLFPDPHT